MTKYFLFLFPLMALAQSNQPTPLNNVFIPGIRSTTILDNRSSVNRQITYSSVACSGSGSWSVSLQYASSTSGPWTPVPGAATVTDASSPSIAYGFLLNYPNYYRVLVSSGSPVCSFSGFQNLFVSTGNSNVVSVFGRIGAVVAQSGDYTAAQVTNAVSTTGSYANPSWITSISAAKLIGIVAAANGGAGSVNGVLKANGAGLVSAAVAGSDYVIPSGNVATATALAANPTNCSGSLPRGIDANGNAEGCADVDLTAEVTGTLPAANGGTGRTAFSRSGNTDEYANVSGAKTTGKQLAFDASGNVIASTSDIGGGGADIGLAVSRTNSTVLAIAAGSARTGNTTTVFSASTATLSGTSDNGTAFVYVTAATLFVGHNTAATITCSGCTTVTGVTSFPANSIPLATATFTSTTWDTSGVVDFRSALSTKALAAGSNITISDSGGVATISATGGGVPSCASGQVVPLTWEYNADFQQAGQGAFTALANRVYGFVLPCTGTPSTFGFSVTTASGTCAGTCGLAVAFYSAAGARLANATVATSGGSPNINTTGFKVLTLSSPPALTGGVLYYVALSTDSTALSLTAPNNWAVCDFRNAMAVYCASAANSSTGSGGSIASPSTLGTLTATTGSSNTSMVPYLYLRF